MNDVDEAVKRYEAGHAWDDAAEVIEAEFKQPLDKVVPVRLSADTWEALRREAQELGIGPTTLARMWLLERLRNLRTSRGPAPPEEPSAARRGRSRRRAATSAGKSK